MRKLMLVGCGAALMGVLAYGILTDRDATPDGYLVLAASWTPSWCQLEGQARGAPRCAAGMGAGWQVHGLWPQHNDGTWPEFCTTLHDAPDADLLGAMRDIMGSAGLAGHQWRKHGTCSGLSAAAYLDQTRRAFEMLEFPAVPEGDRVTPATLLADFRAANPGIGPDMAVLTCRRGLAQEIRLCLTHALDPRPCDSELLARTCRAPQVSLPAPR